MTDVKPDAPEQRFWDVVIVGTGMGGATLGFALAQSGYSVLFCEKGRSHRSGDGISSPLRGLYAEQYFPEPAAPSAKHKSILERCGRAYDYLEDQSAKSPQAFIPFIGCGTGGSSALYGMALERFSSADFKPGEAFRNHPLLKQSSLPECWPVSYEEFIPYYAAAELLYQVKPAKHGGEITAASHEIFKHFEQQGLCPYRLPMACQYVSECTHDCQSFLCRTDCKQDSSTVALQPAIEKYGAQLLENCEVHNIITDRNQVNSIEADWNGVPIRLRARVFILAAGALETPCLLLNSANDAWPRGVANDSGLVGKNLMRHYVDLYGVRVPQAQGLLGNTKEIASNYFYFYDGEKLGTIQSFGTMLPPSIVVSELQKEASAGPLSFLGTLIKWTRPILEYILEKKFSHSLLLATLLEDLPFEQNFVRPPSSSEKARGLRWVLEYRIPKAERVRIQKFRNIMKEILKPYPYDLIKQAENNARIAHVCGTCRFGEDPRTSVLDRNNQAHGLRNLYVVDASFFPSSGGINPALTIAANALRVAEHLKNVL